MAKIFGGPSNSRARSLLEVADGGLIVAGVAITEGGDTASYLLKTDSKGNRLWERTLVGLQAFSVEATADGGFVVAGWTLCCPNNFYVVKTDSDGKPVWQRIIEGIQKSGNPPEVHQTSDGGYILVGDMPVYLVRLDPDGQILWGRRVVGDPNGFESGNAVQTTPDGGYMIAARSSIIRTDSAGNQLWHQVLRGGVNARSLRSTKDGGFIVVGWTTSLGPQGGDGLNVYLAKLGGPKFRRGDADGNGDVNITDAVFTLNHLFLGGAEPDCADAADADDNGTLNVTDAAFLLNHLFAGGPAPAAPFVECGVDSTLDELSCDSFPSC